MWRNRASALLFVAWLFALLPWTAAAQEPAEVSLQPPTSLPAVGETFTTDVAVANATDLLGFQFDVNFDPATLAVETITLGPFLAGSGRSPQPLGPDMANAANGRVVFGGFTLGTPDQPGASGDGVLATITWKVLQPADFQASLSRVQLAGANGRALPGSDTPAPATPAASQVEQPQTAATESPAQPDPTLAAVQAAAAAEQKATATLPILALVVGVAVVIVAVALVLARRGKSNPS